MDQINNLDITSTFVPLSILTASLVGSLHCVSMCGALVLSSTHSPTSTGLYHFGRLLGYLILGGLAGFIGQSLFAYSNALAIVSALLIGGMLIYLGIQSWQGKGMHLPLPPFVLKFLSKIMGKENLPKNFQAFVVGSFSAFLPCGWLYSFVLAALATQAPLKGALLLGFFWLGTLPALVVAPSVIRSVLNPIAKKAPKISGAVLIVAGLVTVGYKLRIPPPELDSTTQEEMHCHH